MSELNARMIRRDAQPSARSRATRRVKRGDIFLKIQAGGGLEYSSRNKRELQVVHGLGLEPLVLAKGERNESVVVEGWRCQLKTTKPLGERSLLTPLNRVLSLVTWAMEARRIEPSVISGHDLIGTTIAWMSTLGLAKSKRPHIVYDSHEFELGRHMHGRGGRISYECRRIAERFLLRRASFSIMVNESIAQEVSRIHNHAGRMVVVRSTPPEWHTPAEDKEERRREILESLNMPDSTFVMMYHGVVVPGRGIEVCIDALKARDSVALVVLGNAPAGYMDELRLRAQNLNVAERLLFLPAVPTEAIGEFAGAADVGMIVIPAVAKSYYYMLPNKLFENVQSSTPVIASDFPEVRRIVEGYDVGILVDPQNLHQVNEALSRLMSDSGLRERLRKNTLKAKSVLCWEQEHKVLADAYTELMT